MNRKACLLLLAALGCDGQQYVSPDTVGLTITNDDTGVTRVSRCNYVPVLLGSRVKFRYVVEGDLKATIDIDRNEVVVSFEGDDGEVLPFTVRTKELEDGGSFTADSPPDGYTVRLSSGCTPDD